MYVCACDSWLTVRTSQLFAKFYTITDPHTHYILYHIWFSIPDRHDVMMIFFDKQNKRKFTSCAALSNMEERTPCRSQSMYIYILFPRYEHLLDEPGDWSSTQRSHYRGGMHCSEIIVVLSWQKQFFNNFSFFIKTI